ncbi:uncharacterized protein EI97DRAFT_443311 [Westerdykella ornata]|uniref:Uncharacterized protein n=1 Tax=Westerdykella ornata TaxID=318751 RepID=A0A6A6JFY6_WESOR|nr:uncharacterized protein EI97DRAFT_443311 [Westerdykella ornata]KAF2275461.1 hypothetical protein EI97DRAFT_443311 [Westerdykella ornata]
MPPPPQVRPHPAEPILASSLIDEELLDHVLDRALLGHGFGRSPANASCGRITTGVKSVDDVLGGGVESGCVLGVSGGLGRGGESELCLALLVSSLLSPPSPPSPPSYPTAASITTPPSTVPAAAIIDTTGNVDVLRIYSLILHRLRNQPDVRQVCQDSIPGAKTLSLEDLAARVLDKVKIMRVFDLTGVMEAITEIGDGLEGVKNSGGEDQREAVVKKEGTVFEEVVPGRQEMSKRFGERRTMVADSEDEDEEMLFDAEETDDVDPHISVVENETQAKYVPDTLAPLPPSKLERSNDTETSPPPVPRASFILVDNLAHVIAPLLRKDYTQAHILSHAILRSLSTLTKTHSLHTLLLNPTSVPYSPKPRLEATTPEPNQPQHQRPRQPPPPPASIFSSNIAIPALANILSPCLDMHLLVSRMPKRKVDARKLAAIGEVDVIGMGEKERRLGVHMAWVVEVLMDRWEGREGDWGGFDIADGGVVEL